MPPPVERRTGADVPPAERRAGVRQRLMLRTAKLRCASGEYLCVIHDVSETGARLRLFHAHPPDSHMFLELGNGELYALERRRIDGSFAGCRFSSRIDIDAFVREASPKPRRPLRLRIARPVAIAIAGECVRAELVNLSQHGACLDAARPLPLRAPLHFDISGTSRRLAHVCWRRRDRHGLVFQEALTLEALAHLALQLQPYAAEQPYAVEPSIGATSLATPRALSA